MSRLMASLLMLFSVSALPAMAAENPADHVGVGPAPIENMQMSPVIDEAQFARMQSALDPRVRSGEVTPSERTNTWAYMWYCVAQSTLTGNWYYWYSYNAYYARNQALSACVAVNGYTCNVGCQIQY